MKITVTEDSEKSLGFFNLYAYLNKLVEEGFLFHIMTVDDGEILNVEISGIDKNSPNPCMLVKDDEGDSCIVFIHQIISITPTSPNKEASEDEDEEEYEEEASEEEA